MVHTNAPPPHAPMDAEMLPSLETWLGANLGPAPFVIDSAVGEPEADQFLSVLGKKLRFG